MDSAPANTVSILDVTIRDGSYAINYQYQPEYVAKIVGLLDAAGIDYIEVSHGCGLGARENLGLPAAASDEAYVAAARGAVTRAKIGVIAGPEPTTKLADIDRILDQVDFIRFAANCDNPGAIEKHVRHALKKRPDLAVFLQLMRSSRRPLKTIVEAAKQAKDMGVQILYLVDTAGHFVPEEVFDIVTSLREDGGIAVGFHGHNNLGLAVANTLSAVWAGATSIDASLRGMGRAAGNAQLEAVISVLQRSGMRRDIDLGRLIAAGEELIAPIMPPAKGIAAIDVITADANIDLYPLAFYERIAMEAGVGLESLILTLGADPTTVEAGPGEVKRALETLGADADKVFATLGIAWNEESK